MRPIEDLIIEVRAEEQQARDHDLAVHHEMNRKLNLMFEELSRPVVNRTFDHPHVDHLENGINFIVKRAGMTVCEVHKDGKHIKLLFGEELGLVPPVDLYQHPEAATKKVLRVLSEHQRLFPIREAAVGWR